MRQLILAVMSLFTLAACSKMVNEPRQDVISRLVHMPSEADVMDLAKQVPNANFRSEENTEGVDWVFTISGNDICRFSAKVAAAGDGVSSVATAMEELGDQHETYLCNIARITGEESVAATLEGRPANVEAVNQQLTQYMVTNMAAVDTMVSRRMDEMAPSAEVCKSGDSEARRNCRKFMRMRAQEMHEQGFDHP